MSLGIRSFEYKTLGWETVNSLNRADNNPSVHVAERLGATFERVALFRQADCAIYRYPSCAALRLN